ncbi:hypothetical protein KR026_005713, partial [Drosophila bipectinata]
TFNMKYSGILFVILLILCPGIHGANFRFTNIECKDMDSNFLETKECLLKLVRRNVAAIRLHMLIKYAEPLDQIKINFCLFRKSNVYRLFMINHTLDFCYFMRNPEKYPIFYIFHDSMKSFTTVNHTCPYEEKNIYINNLTLDESAVTRFPFPEGEYKMSFTTSIFKAWRININIYVHYK